MFTELQNIKAQISSNKAHVRSKYISVTRSVESNNFPYGD